MRSIVLVSLFCLGRVRGTSLSIAVLSCVCFTPVRSPDVGQVPLSEYEEVVGASGTTYYRLARSFWQPAYTAAMLATDDTMATFERELGLADIGLVRIDCMATCTDAHNSGQDCVGYSYTGPSYYSGCIDWGGSPELPGK